MLYLELKRILCISFENAFNDFPKLRTDRLILREIILSDASSFYEHHKTIHGSPFWDGELQSVEETENLITKIRKRYENQESIHWGISLKDNDELIGCCLMFEFELKSKVALGFWLSEEYQGRGIVTEAVKCIVDYGLTHMNLHRITSGCHPENFASYKVLLRSGFKVEGRLREFNYRKAYGWSDSIMVSILRREYLKT